MSERTDFYPWERSIPDRFARPTQPFIPFEAAEIEQSIPQRFEKQVKLYPERLAVRDRVYEYTYDQLNQAANRVAWAILAERGDGPSNVAMLFEHRVQAIAAFLGALKAGKAYVPLDPLYPHGRLDHMLRDSQADLIIADSEHLGLARELARGADAAHGGCRVLGFSELDSGLSTENLERSIPLDTYAYILYTSGSTGKPKGVVEDHRNVLHFSMVIGNGFHVSPEDRFSLLPSLCFSGSASDIYPSLLMGAACISFDVQREGLASLGRWLIDQEITRYKSVPALFRQLCDTLEDGQEFPKLRIIAMGGDRVEKGDVELCRKHFSPDCVFNIGLGATECKVITRLFVNRDSPLSEGVLPAGYAVDDVDILMLDEKGQRVGPQEVGEIAVKSRYVSPGYWRSPELTKEKFRPDPDGSEARIYLTGDMGRLAPDGCLTHLGRKDFQVKIRGYRVEIAEVEAVLLDLDAVKEAVVVAREGAGGEQQLVAYVVSAARTAPTASSLRLALTEHLPHYMIPSAFVMMDEMPLNANGKIDRLALPAPDTSRPKLGSAYVAPRDTWEDELVQIWEEVLDVRPIGIRDSFFDLGGHSLLTARLFAQIEARFEQAANGAMSLEKFFRMPTVEQLAILLRGSSLDGQSAPGTTYRRSRKDPPLVALKNRLLQIAALYAPGAKTVRVRLHRLRGVRIGEDVFLGLGVILESGYPRMVSIGSHVTISVRSVVIAHFAGSARWARASDEPSVRIEDNAYIGPGVVILPNVTIGQGAVVAAGSVVSQSVPPGVMVQGNPAKPIATCGVPLKGNTYERFLRGLKFIDG